jgi:DNA-binding transcriptional ArsR family regulator
MADEKPQKVSVGFIGSQVLSGRIVPAELSKLRDALGTEGWRDIRFEDGTVALDLSKVVYVLVEDEEHRVGFGA